MAKGWRDVVLGEKRDLRSPRTYHAISLVALLAWVGLGADGLSSSAYGPDEAFRALGSHTYLAIALAAATALTVTVISIAYSQIIRRFPFGGGGYVVATELLGPGWGVVSGCALLIDYVLTIAVSIASGADQVFSVIPTQHHSFKLIVSATVIVVMVVLNLRGVRESVTILAPIFGLFLLTHAILIIGGIGMHLGAVPHVASEVRSGFSSGLSSLGALGLFAVFLRAYSMGAGTYTGIEAVSNGIQIMREPKIETARKTMLYMALSLALTAAGILVCYLLFHTQPETGKTMNATLLEQFAGAFNIGGWPVGRWFVIVSLAAEAALLFVAAQAGFLDGPRVMSNMAHDHWLPHRFGQISDRLTVQDGVLLMGFSSLAMLLYTRGNITTLVTMYSINVFVTFSLSQVGMLRYWLRSSSKGRVKGFAIHGVAFLLCFGILVGVVYEKALIGGWVTIVVTSLLIALCFRIRAHYRSVHRSFKELDEIISSLPPDPDRMALELEPAGHTAVLMVGAFGGLGIHALLAVQRLFPGHFRNVVFASVAVIDAATMKGVEEVDHVHNATAADLAKYVQLARRFGLAADSAMRVSTEVVEEGALLAAEIRARYPRSVFFMGNLVFEKEGWFNRILHNNTAFRLQRRLQFSGINTMILPVRVMQRVSTDVA